MCNNGDIRLSNHPSLDMDAEPLQMIFEVAEDDPSFLLELLENVLEFAPSIFSEIEAGVNEMDVAKIKIQTHSLKSSSSQVGAMNLSVMCFDIETTAAAGDLSDITAQYAALKAEFDVVIEALEEWKSLLEEE